MKCIADSTGKIMAEFCGEVVFILKDGEVELYANPHNLDSGELAKAEGVAKMAMALTKTNHVHLLRTEIGTFLPSDQYSIVC